MLRLRELESELQAVRPFDKRKQKPNLEQYPTSPHLAAHMVYTAATAFGDVEGRVVVDLGCGTGMLGFGCGMMGAGSVTGLDADLDALEVAVANRSELELDDAMDFVLCDVSSMPLACGRSGVPTSVDTVIMNPPFGTRNKGIDVVFIERALALQPRAIFSLHKSSTRGFLMQKASRDWGVQAQVLAQLRFDVPQMYKFHKKKSVDVEVDFIRFELPQRPEASLPSGAAAEDHEERDDPAAVAVEEGPVAASLPSPDDARVSTTIAPPPPADDAP